MTRGSSIAGAVAAMLAMCVGGAVHGQDSWSGRDKFYHFTASMVMSQATFTTLSWADSEERKVLWSGMAVGITALVGAGKELFDLASGRSFSTKDFAWDLVGAAAGTALSVLLYSFLSTDEGSGHTPQAPAPETTR